jgi:transcription elongation factor GreA
VDGDAEIVNLFAVHGVVSVPLDPGGRRERGAAVANLSRVTTETHLSQDAHDRLLDEFEDLTTRGRIEIAQKIEEARLLGDLSENGDYHAAKEEQGKMEGRIAHLGAILEGAVIVAQADGDSVQAGCVVSIRYEGNDSTERYLIGSIEEKREGIDVISPGSPLGSALLGQTPGEVVDFQAPNGTLKVEIIDIES